MQTLVTILLLAGLGAAIALAALLAVRPTRRVALVAAAAAPVWLLSGPPLGTGVALAITAAVVVAFVADLLLLPGRVSLEVERALPPTVGLGDEAEGEIGVVSLWPFRVRLAVHEALPPGLERAGDPATALGALVLEPGHAGRVASIVRGTARGAHALSDVVLVATGPLGLAHRALRHSPGGEITVIPSMAGVRRFRLLALQQRMREAGMRTLRRRGGGTSFAGLREYSLGDDPRHIDWKGSARRDTLVAREFTVEQGQTVLLAIDAGRMMTQLAGDRARFEHALSSALILADIAARSGDQVGLIVFDDEIRAFVPPAKGTHALHRVREALVVAQPRLVEPDYAAAFRTLATRHRRRSLLVVFTDVVDARSSKAIVAHTARSAARHLPLVVALRNDALELAARPTASHDADALYASAAAEELLAARAEALARMRRHGVGVLDVSPERMTAAVVNRYLEIKGRGML